MRSSKCNVPSNDGPSGRFTTDKTSTSVCTLVIVIIVCACVLQIYVSYIQVESAYICRFRMSRIFIIVFIGKKRFYICALFLVLQINHFKQFYMQLSTTLNQLFKPDTKLLSVS